MKWDINDCGLFVCLKNKAQIGILFYKNKKQTLKWGVGECDNQKKKKAFN